METKKDNKPTETTTTNKKDTSYDEMKTYPVQAQSSTSTNKKDLDRQSHNHYDTRYRSSSSHRSRSRSRSRNDREDDNEEEDEGRLKHQSNQEPYEQRRPNEKGPALDFLIFLSKPLESALLEKSILTKIEEQIGNIKMEFDFAFMIPDYNGTLLKIKSDDIKKKRDATQQLLEFIVKNDLDEPKNEKKTSDKIGIVIMIPNGLVSMVIGTHGKQISNLINESKAQIVINQPIYKMTYRTVSISGKASNVSNAIMNIHQIMEDRYNEIAKIEFECKPLNVITTQTCVKLIFNIEIIDILSSKKHVFIDLLQDEFNVSTKIYQDRKNRQLERKDYICSLKGTIDHVQSAIIEITRKVKNYIRTTFDGKESFTLRMLINKVFVTKLIGAGGCMIQEIANFSKGASIKIMSNKHDEKKSSCHDIPVCIAGSFCSVQDASCIIIEQMECFKNGGPVLKSGKSLHQNIAHQFINSIFTTGDNKDNEDERIYTLKDRFLSGKRNRSESEEKSKSKEDKKHSKDKDHSHSHSRSHSRSHSKSRSRSHNRDHSRSHDRSNRDKDRSHHDHSRSRHDNSDKRYHKKDDSSLPRQDKKSNEFDSSHNFSYEENGQMKISTDFIVPDHLVSLLIGKNGENVRAIMSKSGSIITFSKEYNDDCKFNTTNGTGRMCNLKGTPQQNSFAMQLILELIIKFEITLSGVKKEK